MKKIIYTLLATALIISCVTIPVSAAGIMEGPSNADISANEWMVLRETNQVRWDDAKYGPLTTFKTLNDAAGIRAEEQTKLFGHIRPNGKGFDTVLAEAGLSDLDVTVGENAAISDETPAEIVSAWRASPGHYQNMLGNGTSTIIESDGKGGQTETEREIKDFFRHMGAGQYNNGWIQLFYGRNPASGEFTEDELNTFADKYVCNYTKLSITSPASEKTFVKGTSITDMNLVGVLTCDKHGDCYFPVLSEYCSGYNANTDGTQTVTVSVYGQTATVKITIEGSTKMPFTDVKSNQWYYNNVKYVYDNGLMNGVSDTKFDPDGTMTRGMMVTVLYRYEGEPSVSGKTNPFSDVPSNKYYTNAVKWAYANGIVNGTSSTKFSPDDKITREQIVTIFYRYANYNSSDITKLANLNGYSDADKVSNYAKSAFQWAVANGIINGTSITTLSPKENATRAQCAAIIQRFAGL